MASLCEIGIEPRPTLAFHRVDVTDWRPGWTVYMTATVDLFPDAAANVASQVAHPGTWARWPS
jgi:hypothetical protein